MDLREAMAQVAEIRQQMAQAATFRGYRAATTALSGTVALVAAGLQEWVAPRPVEQLTLYLALWIGAALVSVSVYAMELTWRYRRSASQLQREVTLLVVEQFVPSLIAGGMLTAVVVRFTPSAAWMLPGLWAMAFSLGVFASRRFLPGAIFWVGAFYMLAGMVCLALGQAEAALSPWTMGLTFGAGQFLSAGILYWTLERNHEQER